MKAFLLSVALVASLSAQEPTVSDAGVAKIGTAAAPTLTVEQKQAIQLLTKDLEIAQLRALAAQKDFDAAKADLIRLAAALHRPGFQLDLQAGTYTPSPPPPATTEPAK